MNAPTPRKLSVFALAKCPGGFSVQLRPEDVMALRPDWSRQQAKEFLGRHARSAAESMIAAGLVAIAEAIDAEDRNVQ